MAPEHGAQHEWSRIRFEAESGRPSRSAGATESELALREPALRKLALPELAQPELAQPELALPELTCRRASEISGWRAAQNAFVRRLLRSISVVASSVCQIKFSYIMFINRSLTNWATAYGFAALVSNNENLNSPKQWGLHE